jgi:DNA polymerase I-like protein with 3'-5' exonuclease and polymerase domains
VYCTNIICWWNDSPTLAEQQPCRERLMRELAAIQPRLIITLGAIAREALTGRPFSGNRGVPLWQDFVWSGDTDKGESRVEFGCYTMPTYHPAAIYHGGFQLIHDLARDLWKIPLVLEYPPRVGLSEVNYHVIETLEEAQRVLDQLPRRETGTIVTLDVETDAIEGDPNRDVDAIDVYNDQLSCWSITWGWNNTVVFPRHVLVPELRLPTDVRWGFQNGIYDTQVIKRFLDQWLPIAEDSLLMSYSVDERIGLHRLGTLASEYLGTGPYKDEVKALRKRRIPIPPAKLHDYNAKDAAYDWRLFPILGARLDEEETERPYRELLIPAANALKEITYRGIKVDPDVVRELFMDWAPKMLEEEEALVQMASDLGFGGVINLNSSQQLGRLLFQTLGLPTFKWTKTGNPSVDKESLGALSGSHPFVDRLLAWRQLEHMIGTYLLGIQDDLKSDGRIHADPVLQGTATGRMAYHNPPLQTIPNDEVVGEDYGRLRNLFVATDDDHIIVAPDYKQAEVWTAYAYSLDPQMYEDLQGDFHRAGASGIYGKPQSEITPIERRANKYVAFGIMYGRGAPSLAMGELKVDPIIAGFMKAGQQQQAFNVADRYIKRWLARYPQYAAWREKQKRDAAEEGELITMTGRKRRFLLVIGTESFKALNQAVNFPIQSTAHDVLLSALVELHERLKPLCGHILFEVHDSLIMEVHKRHFAESMQLIYDVMTAVRFPGMVSIPVEFKVGKSWGQATKWNLGDPIPC